MGKRLDKSGNCAICGIFRSVLNRDRIVPGCKGGKYEPGNIQWLCANCHQDKTALEVSEAHKGKPKSPEHRAKMSAWQVGRPKPEAVREKISASLRGRKQPPELVAKRAATVRGRKYTPDHRAAISAALKALPSRRGTHCPFGHDYATHGRATSEGGIECRACRNGRKVAKRANETPEEKAARLEQRRRQKAAGAGKKGSAPGVVG